MPCHALSHALARLGAPFASDASHNMPSLGVATRVLPVLPMENGFSAGLCTLYHALSRFVTLQIGGPVWLGPLHSKDFVQTLQTNLKEDGRLIRVLSPCCLF